MENMRGAWMYTKRYKFIIIAFLAMAMTCGLLTGVFSEEAHAQGGTPPGPTSIKNEFTTMIDSENWIMACPHKHWDELDEDMRYCESSGS